MEDIFPSVSLPLTDALTRLYSSRYRARVAT